MSWDIVLFNSRKKITDPAEIEEDQLIPTSFSTAFEAYFKDINKDDDRREIKGDSYSINYFDSDEPISNMLLNLYGEKALYPLIDLAIKNNWQIFDTGLGEMIDLSNPSKNGYKNFQTYLKQILNDKY